MDAFDTSIARALRNRLDEMEHAHLIPQASFSDRAVRRHPEPKLASDYRQAYSIDVDRILHSHAYTRYIDKTQVFYLVENDHITHRVLHVQLVSKISRTIGKFLGLNQDLIEAIALGHDIGHTPFGHEGETYLSELCREHGIGHFLHNVQSIQFLDRVERNGEGWNLCLETLDGILCHDGEIHERALEPNRGKTFADLDREAETKKTHPAHVLSPTTLEGCVVRMADTISYIGRDIEDAIRLGLIRREDLPKDCKAVLGDTNGTIVWRLVTDLITNSIGQDRLVFRAEISEALKRLKDFNLERIYLNPRIKRHSRSIRAMFRYLFERYLEDLQKGHSESLIFQSFLHQKAQAYREHHRPAEIVRDFISGMTDRFFLRQCPDDMKADMAPLPIP
uniref:HD domain-containing protein n=1 Tax=Desulfatirhabdium butyrativorans TaxID=340467 RepID=A0A7C4MP03_9BACT